MMKTLYYLVALFTVLSFPQICLSDGTFFWSDHGFGQGASVDDEITNVTGNDPAEGKLVYLYYLPDSQPISDSFSIDFRFEGFAVLNAQIFNFPVTIGGGVVNGVNRWENIGEPEIAGDRVLGFSASNSEPIGGIHDGIGALSDTGYDPTANAFQIGSVTLRGLPTGEIQHSSTFIDQGEEVFPEIIDLPQFSGQCLLDPPYSFFDARFSLLPGNSPVAGFWHCILPFGPTCDGTLWYRFDPNSNGIFTCDTFGSLVSNTALEIYLGDSFSQLGFVPKPLYR